MLFPQEPPTSFTKWLTGAAKKLFFGSTSEVKHLNFTVAQEVCLHAFLSEHGKLLKDLDSPSSSKVPNLEKFVNVVYKIYEQLHVRQTCKNDKKDDDWVAVSLAKVKLFCW